jgi:hypothetical protein
MSRLEDPLIVFQTSIVYYTYSYTISVKSIKSEQDNKYKAC